MKEKKLMTSFFAANMIDIAVSWYAVSNLGFKDIGPLARQFLEAGEPQNAAIFRTAVTAILIGSYALSKVTNEKLSYSYEKALQISNVFCWGVNVLNMAQITAQKIF